MARRRGRKARTKEAVAVVLQKAKRDVSESERLRHAIAAKFLGHGYAIHYEVGLNSGGRLRADVLGLSMGGIISIGEVKSSPADFKADKKWKRYIKYAHRFHFIFNEKTYEAVSELVPKGVGIWVVDSNNKVRSVQNCKQRAMSPKFNLLVVTRIAYRSADENSTTHKNALSVPSLLRKEVLLNLDKAHHAVVGAAIDKATHKILR